LPRRPSKVFYRVEDTGGGLKIRADRGQGPIHREEST